VHRYLPSLPEVLLGLAGVAIAGIIVALAVKLLRFLPENLADGTTGTIGAAGADVAAVKAG
ncbi:MAG: hypothetical protein KAX84_16305, partial [Burkholderiales bacterium]|nr:hypothetical protein [Burkholderiales bacterium]